MIVAPTGIVTFLPTSVIRLPETRIVAFSRGLSDLPSTILPHLMAVIWEASREGNKNIIKTNNMRLVIMAISEVRMWWRNCAAQYPYSGA